MPISRRVGQWPLTSSTRRLLLVRFQPRRSGSVVQPGGRRVRNAEMRVRLPPDPWARMSAGDGLLCKQKVAGSNPAASMALEAQDGGAPRWYRGGGPVRPRPRALAGVAQPEERRSSKPMVVSSSLTTRFVSRFFPGRTRPAKPRRLVRLQPATLLRSFAGRIWQPASNRRLGVRLLTSACTRTTRTLCNGSPGVARRWRSSLTAKLNWKST